MATYRGLPACSCQVAWLPVYERLLAKYQIVIRWTQLIGGYAASGDTHSGGGAADGVIVSTGPRSHAAAYALAVKLARWGGADATWHRPTNWDNRGGIEHMHSVLTACPHRTRAAINQVNDVRNGLNGLANRARDTGPRPVLKRHWAPGIKWMAKQLKPTPDKYSVYVSQVPGDFISHPVAVHDGPGQHTKVIGSKEHGDLFTASGKTKTMRSGGLWREGINGGWIPDRRLNLRK